jgi:hypothetical protein
LVLVRRRQRVGGTGQDTERCRLRGVGAIAGLPCVIHDSRGTLYPYLVLCLLFQVRSEDYRPRETYVTKSVPTGVI